jgi:hypothetical protein
MLGIIFFSMTILYTLQSQKQLGCRGML